MQYEIWGGQMPAVTMQLNAGESVYTQSGGLSWMSDGISMETNMKGGFGKALGRMFSGESLFMATYTAQRPGASITFASSMPGEIKVLEIGPAGNTSPRRTPFCARTPM